MRAHGKNLTLAFQKRIESARLRVLTLSSLRKTVSLPAHHDISDRQWSVLEAQLSAVRERILSRLKRGVDAYVNGPLVHVSARTLNAYLGKIELDLSRAFTFFDTYMDVLTQRLMPEMGPLLAGCDVLARDAMNRDHPALTIIEPPLVFCDRGFGASIVREEVPLPDGTPNPMPLIQIPYSRLKEKYNLTSILHEAGHQAMVRLRLTPLLPRVFHHALIRAGAPANIAGLFAGWTSEIGPDFWGFCASGAAQAATLKEILALPPDRVFRIIPGDPHPSPYLRVLLSFAWCRQVWGRGEWDDWEEEWRMLYPLAGTAPETRDLCRNALLYLPHVSRVLLNTKFGALHGKTLPDLFDLSAIAPAELRRVAGTAARGSLNLQGLSPSAQLAVFRIIRDRGRIPEEEIDAIMSKWLIGLGKMRRNPPGETREYTSAERSGSWRIPSHPSPSFAVTSCRYREHQ